MSLEDYQTEYIKLDLESFKLDKQKEQLNLECIELFGVHANRSTKPHLEAIQQLEQEVIKLPIQIKNKLLSYTKPNQEQVIIPTSLLKRRYSHELKHYNIPSQELIKELDTNTRGHKVNIYVLRPTKVIM